MRCWHCLTLEVMESGLVKNVVDLKWEFVRRRLSLRLLTGLGTCLESCSQVHETREIIADCINLGQPKPIFSYYLNCSIDFLV
ncbi:hypothetical protein ACFX1X_044884 [Malus domestica]